MLTKVTLLKNCEAELAVELEKSELQKYLEEAGKKISGFVKVDGFRSGKVPFEVLRKKIGDEKILQEALEISVADSLTKALKKENLEVMSSSGLKIHENSVEALKYSVTLQLFPKVKLGNYKKLGVPKRDVQVEDKEIEDAIAFLLKSQTSFEDTDEPAARGHRLEIDLEVSENGRLIEGGKSENFPLILSKGGFVPGFEEQLEGVKKGDTKTFTLKVPSDYYQKEIAGKSLDFKVTVKAVKFGRAPELTDEFVKKLGKGNFESVEDLKKNIAVTLKTDKDQKEKDRVKLEILEKINKSSDIKIPARLVEEQLDIMTTNFDRSLHEKGMELGLYLAHIKKTQEDLRKEWYDQAESQIRKALITREIGKKEKINVSEEEIQGMASSLMARNMLSGGLQIDQEKLRQKTEETLVNDKILEFLEKSN